MTNEEFVVRMMPECIKGFKVDWSRYIPSGGWQFQKAFHERKIPVIESAIAESEQKVAVISSRLKLLTALDEAAYSFVRKADDISKQGLDSELSEAVRSAIAACVRVSNETAELTGSVTKVGDEAKRLMEDIEFLKSFREFFVKDLELDMMLWALEDVPLKFKTKVFRTTFKLLPEVERLFGIVKGSTSAMAANLREMFDTPIREFEKCYSTLPKLLRFQNKILKQEGEGYWRNRDVVEAERMRREVSARATGWKVEF